MLSLILLGPPLGVVFGYALTATAIELFNDWRTSFFIQGLSMAISFFIMILIPDKYINIDEVLVLKREEKVRKNLLLQQEKKLADKFLEADLNSRLMGEKGGTQEFGIKSFDIKNIKEDPTRFDLTTRDRTQSQNMPLVRIS